MNGDEVFSGCSSLKEIDLSSLETVESWAIKIFEGCSQLATINLPSKEPLQFHKNTFKDMPNVKHFEGCYSIEKVDLSGLKTVNQTSENIFKNCSKLSQIKLGNEPPLLFNENVFVNAGIDPNVSIPNNENWVNYISQSTIDPSCNHYIWFGYDTGLEKKKK